MNFTIAVGYQHNPKVVTLTALKEFLKDCKTMGYDMTRDRKESSSYIVTGHGQKYRLFVNLVA